MRRIPTQIRLHPTFEQRMRHEIEADHTGKTTRTGIIERALADHYRETDDTPTLNKISEDLHTLGQIVHGDVLNALADMKRVIAALNTSLTHREASTKKVIDGLAAEKATLETALADLRTELFGLRQEVTRVANRKLFGGR